MLSISLYLFASKSATMLAMTFSSKDLYFLHFRIRHYFVLDFFHGIQCELTMLQASILNANPAPCSKGRLDSSREVIFVVRALHDSQVQPACQSCCTAPYGWTFSVYESIVLLKDVFDMLSFLAILNGIPVNSLMHALVKIWMHFQLSAI